MKLRKLLYWAPFTAMGPVSGPLAEGIVRNLRKGNRLLAVLYAIALVETFFVLPMLLVAALEWRARVVG
jgi:hypothetical protein